jgi:galactose mutarotase-like enzyme
MELQLRSNQLTVKIKEQGAEMCSVTNKKDIEFVWQANEKIWPRHAPVLFPIVGKLKENKYEFDGQSYQLGQHGFARDMKFKVVERSDTKCTLELQSDSKSKKQYPFDFSLKIIYELSNNELTTRYQVENKGAKKMFFSIGAHPGFRCPLEANEKFEDYYIEFEHDTFLQTVLQDGLRSSTNKVLPLVGKKLYLSENLFDEDALVFENHQISKISLRSSKSDHKITMECKDWPYYGIWSKKGCTEFVCLEPWYGIADREDTTGELSKKEGIITLDPSQKFDCSFATTFS